jgi:hypothetical protein
MRLTLACGAVLASFAASAYGQSPTGTPLAPSPYPDARLIPRGVLRVSFEPEYITYDHLYDENGNFVPLGAPYSSDSAGADLFSTAATAQASVRDLTGLASYRLTIGALATERDADIRRFPFNFALGLRDNLTLTASVPIVTTRTQVSFTLDTVGANAGLNPAADDGPTILTIVNSFEAQADFVDAQIAAGNYGCPTSPECDAARNTVMRTRTLVAELRAMFAADPLPAFVPLASSAEGQVINEFASGIASELAALGAEPSAFTLPLPTMQVDSAGIQRVLTQASFGYEAFPFDFVKRRQRLGDLELGFRWGLVQSDALRAVLVGTARLPTGIRDDPDHFIDFGTGDRQTDVIGGLEAVWMPGDILALAVTGDYTIQFKDQLVRRASDAPFAPLATRQTVTRDLGDVLRLSAYPSLRLSDAFTAYGSVHYFRQGPETDGASTRLETLSLGAGVHYSPHGLPDQLPIQAGIDYRAAFRGEHAPKDVRLNFYLRLYYRIFGSEPER